MTDDHGPKHTEDVLREFLEEHPLYAACRFEDHRTRFTLRESEWWPDAISLRCARCRRETTWRRVDLVKGGRPSEQVPFEFYKDNFVLRYTCVRCGQEDAGFWCSIEVDEDAYCVRKQGQSPAWSIVPESSISKALPVEAAEFYRKGLVCVSQNYGLGAVGYFRRVVEIVTGHLLDLVETNAKEVGDQATVDGIAKARGEFPATDRLKHAAGLLPPALRPGGANPLANLYDKYSEGIHSLSDEQCLDIARNMQAILDYLLPSLHDQLTRARDFQAAMGKSKRRRS